LVVAVRTGTTTNRAGRHAQVMREAFAHKAAPAVNPLADERAPGAAINAALCGHWEHDAPGPLTQHHSRIN
jgi:hypothetical protein